MERSWSSLNIASSSSQMPRRMTEASTLSMLMSRPTWLERSWSMIWVLMGLVPTFLTLPSSSSLGMAKYWTSRGMSSGTGFSGSWKCFQMVAAILGYGILVHCSFRNLMSGGRRLRSGGMGQGGLGGAAPPGGGGGGGEAAGGGGGGRGDAAGAGGGARAHGAVLLAGEGGHPG